MRLPAWESDSSRRRRTEGWEPMMLGCLKRLVGALVLAVALGFPAAAHPTSAFRGCIEDGDRCRWQSTVLADGSTARVTGIPTPKHSGSVVRVLRFDPRTGVWQLVGTSIVHRWGKARWLWQVESTDARNRPYPFRFEIPGHGTSTIARLAVVLADE